MAKKKPQQWTWAPSKQLKPNVPEEVKAEVQRKAEDLIEKNLKPAYLKPPPKKPRFNYLTGIHTKWHQSFVYLVGDHASPGPTAISPTYVHPFARLNYTADGKFNVAYMRHTGEWWQIDEGLTLKEAMETIRDNGLLHPPG